MLSTKRAPFRFACGGGAASDVGGSYAAEVLRHLLPTSLCESQFSMGDQYLRQNGREVRGLNSV
jgi:hypothetical protein